MIKTQGVSKRYGAFTALDNVSFEIKPGEIVGLLGPNGAGKTSLIRALTGFFEPSDGTVKIDGIDVVDDPLSVQSRIGYLPEQAPLYPEMLVQEYLSMVADIRQLPDSQRTRRMAEAVWSTGLEEHLTRPIGALSKGFQQRVGLAQAILHQPKVLILDEPTSGLDPTQVVHVRELIQRLAQNATVLFSTHILPEVEQLCERVLILMGGKLCTDARLEDLRATHTAIVSLAVHSTGKLVVQSGDASLEKASAALGEINGVCDVRSVPARSGYASFELQANDEGDLCREAYRLARDRGWELGELRRVERDLESVFNSLVRGNSEVATVADHPSNVTPMEVRP